ncbi:MAG: hypothetical protein JSR58_07120 [Verrucomicrobia bacterium]|nr:hypothetical protein [Verrucomicrobiota bacterium]
MDEKRLFLGIPVIGSWPSSFPDGRLIEEEMRHITLAFFGTTSFERLISLLSSLPQPPFSMGLAGVGDHIKFFSHVAAAHVTWLEEVDLFSKYYEGVQNWLKNHRYPVDTRPFLPHITLARSPFSFHEWKAFFAPIPFYGKSICLYESLGQSHYKPLWEIPLPAPFVEIEHTADIAFCIQGKTPRQLLMHAYLALAFKFPALLTEKIPDDSTHSLDDVIIALNDIISRADQTLGVPFKAVSFHGEHQNNQWTMIVDV